MRQVKLIFIHGSGGTNHVWQHQTDYFPDAEAVTLPGHPEGKSCTSVASYVSWLRGYIQARKYQDVVLAGHSLGGGIVQLYALEHPEDLKAIILTGTGARLRVHPMYLQELEEATKGNIAPLQKRLEERYQLVAPQFARKMIDLALSVPAQSHLNDMLCCDKFDIMDRVGQIKLPTLVICGDKDEMTPVKYSQYLTNQIAGAKPVVIPGGTHHVFMEKPGEFNQAVEEFLYSLR